MVFAFAKKSRYLSRSSAIAAGAHVAVYRLVKALAGHSNPLLADRRGLHFSTSDVSHLPNAAADASKSHI